MSLIAKFFGAGATPATVAAELPPTGSTAPAPAAPAPAPAAAPAVSGLDLIGKLWETDPTAAAANAGPTPVFNLTPERLTEIAMGTDFSKQLPAEMMQKALGGDTQALSALLNTSSQLSFKAGLDATTKMINSAFAQREESFKTDVLPSLIDKRFKSQAISDANPIFNHPAAQPMMNGLKQQLLNKFPQASSQEISELAGEVLQSFADSITSGGTKQSMQRQAATAAAKPTEIDWSEVFK
jgi:hypothetical protein